jgi:rhodanese-related sulfurtransferase
MKTMKKLSILGVFSVLMMLVALSACQSTATPTIAPSTSEIGKVVRVEGGSYTDLSVTGLQRLLDQKGFLLVNVHIPFEGNLPKTDLSIPYDTIGQNLDKLSGDKNAKIVLYCRSGSMSKIAAKELVKLGYTNIWNLDGGMAAWEQAGQPIEK